MDSQREKRVRDLFMQALDVPEGERSTWLESQTGNDPELRHAVDSLLRVSGTAFLQPPSFAMDASDLLGQSLGGYRLLSVLGTGGMGFVYEAEQETPKRRVAVKVLRPLAGTSAAQRFLLEFGATARLQHPGIVTVLESGSRGDLLWYSMELIPGWSLSVLLDKVRAGLPLPDGAPNLRDKRRTVQLVIELLSALEHAHAQGVLHRDVKPGNILIHQNAGTVYLADFGLARDLNDAGFSVSGEVGGTFSYMSPEQASALKNALDARSDIYSVGAVLYELLCQQPPHPGSGPDVLVRILSDEPEPVHKLNKDVSRDLSRICSKALRREREDRYETAEEMRTDLMRWLGGQSVDAQGLSVRRRLARFRPQRRDLLLGAAAAGVLGWAGATFGPRVLAGPKRAKIRLKLGPLDAGADLVYQRLGDMQLGEPMRLGGYEEGVMELSVPWGWGRLTAIVGERSVAFDRQFSSGESLWGRCTSMPTSDDLWARVDGGPVRMEAPHLLPADQAAFQHDVGVAQFMVRRSCVTQGDLRASNAKGVFGSPSVLDANLLAEWRKDTWKKEWEQLPAVRVSRRAAQRYAEMNGGRLLTAAEWKQMASKWIPVGEEPLSSPTRAAKYVLGVSNERTTFEHFASFAKPAADPAYRHGEIFHLFGNVDELTSTAAPMPAFLALEPHPTFYTFGKAWDGAVVASPASDLPVLLGQFGISLAGSPDWSHGFRFAKSTPPEWR